MVQCEYLTLLEMHYKMEKIMRCLQIEIDENQAIFKEDEIVSIIIKDLDTTLLSLIGRENSQGELPLEEERKMYSDMEQQLQRQENLNRTLIKRQLQFKEYQQCLLDELNQEKKNTKQLQNQLSKAKDRLLTKDLEILQLNNEKRMTKDKKNKDYLVFETMVNQKKLGDPFKNMKDGIITLHQRRKSDELTKRSSTAKKKPSITKK